MINVNHWLAPDVLRALGLALAHFLWQGAAIAALAAGAIASVRRASSRYVIAVVALSAMFVAPVITYFTLFTLHRSPYVPNSNLAAAAPILVGAVGHTARNAASFATNVPVAGVSSANLLNWFVALWFAGVLLFSLRTAGGFVVVARMRRRDSRPVSHNLLALCRRLQVCLGITRTIRFCESLHLDAPAVLGWFRPVVFLPVSALTGLTETQLRAVIAHELAHIRRYDAFVNLFQVAVETLLFYHPAVWWLSKRIRAERENCCDDVALGICENAAEYARALALMEQWRVAPGFAMAANRGPLASRVARLLGLSEKGSSLRNAGLAFGVLCAATALVAGNALFGVVRTASALQTPSAAQLPAPPAPEHVITVTAPRPTPAPAAAANLAAPPAPPREPAPAFGQEPSAAPKAQSYIDRMKAEGLDNLSADELIGMKSQGITPQYIHEIRAEGLKPSIDELIGMKVQGITPEYIREMRALKLNTDIDSLIGMKVQGITPDYVGEMRKIWSNLNTDELIGMKVQGITPQYVEEMHKLGFKPDADQIIGLKVQGVSAEYVKQLNDLGLHPDADDIIGMKVQGIDADYIRSIRSTGLNADKDDLLGMKVQGVTADYIKNLQAAGFKPDVEDVISAKVMGVSPEFIKKAQSHGFKDLTLEKIIRLKEAGVLE